MVSCHEGAKSRSYTKTGFEDLRVLVSLWRALFNTQFHHPKEFREALCKCLK
jgi:hypothetical protein